MVVGISDIITFFTLKFPNEIKTYIQSLLKSPLSQKSAPGALPTLTQFLKEASCRQP